MKRFFAAAILGAAIVYGAGELRFSIRNDPKTFDPALVEEEASETVRYLTGGVLMRINRQTQELEPELAQSWTILEGGRTIRLRLREGITFSDGAPFSSDDVAYTFRRLMDPSLHSATGDAFRSAEGNIEITADAPSRITLRFPAPVAGLDRLFDQVAIVSAHSGHKDTAVLGPFRLKEYKPGNFVLLERNPNYWKRPLPLLDAIRLEVQQNREIELLRFERGELHLINTIDPDQFERLKAKLPRAVVDAGPGTDVEFLWFNQAPGSPIAAYKRAWFESAPFRRAISQAIQRDDLCRIVYHGHATPAWGPVTPANRIWLNTSIQPAAYDPQAALRELEQAGFHLENGTLSDDAGRRVEFSLMTNSGNQSRERMGAMIQQDLAKIGIKVSLAALDFPALLERMSRTLDYDACLLGLVNVDMDPNGQMNVWLSSSSMHPWNPKEPQPATAWEAEIDRLMHAQASQLDLKKRKAAFDRVQQILAEQMPVIYLLHKNALSAVSPAVKNAHPVALRPQAFWNADQLSVDEPSAQSRR